MSELIFVTGASGFVGSHIVVQLLDKGYRVRAPSRGGKIEQLTRGYAKYKDQIDIITIPDLANDQFPDALKGVDAIIHVAASTPWDEPENIYSGTVDATLNIIRQAQKAGIKRIVFTSSTATLLNPQNSFTDKDWNPITKDQVVTNRHMYRYAKTLSERELWAFAESHPELEVTSILPPFIYGPFAEGFTVPTPNYFALSANLFIYRLLRPSGPYPNFPGYADVRDVAKAHVLALTSPPTSVLGRKRLPFASPHGINLKTLIQYITEKRPALKGRLVTPDVPVPELPFDRLPFDFDRIEEVLGFKKEEFIGFEESVLAAVDSLLEVEKEWIDKGYTIEIPDPVE